MTFNVNKTRSLMKLKRISQRKMASIINMSHAGFNNALSAGEFKATTLQKISEILEVPIGYFFDEVPLPTLGGIDGKIIPEECREQIIKLEKIIEQQRKDIEFLQDTIKLIESLSGTKKLK